MLYSTSELLKYKVSGVDGELGKITDFYLDDREWSIRYAIVNTNSWLPGGKVLISSHEFNKIDTENEEFHIGLTKEQIKNSPDIDTDQPVSEQSQELLHGYYNWPIYWGHSQNNVGSIGTGGGAIGMYPIRSIQNRETRRADNVGSQNLGDQYVGNQNLGIQNPDVGTRQKNESHLRSFKEIERYSISTSTGEYGKANDFIVKQDSWMIQFMVMDTAKLFSGKNVLIPVDWIKWVSWDEKQVSVWPTKEDLENYPSFDMAYPIHENNEADLKQYYDSTKEWKS